MRPWTPAAPLRSIGRWEDGYYLYRGKLSFESGSESVRFGDIELPAGLHHEDEFFGVQPVYRNRFFVTIPYESDAPRPDSVELIIKSQGCADIGICYPPETWTTSVPLRAAAPTVAASQPFTLGSSGSSEFLPVDEAFKVYAQAVDGNTAEIGFQVTPGHYLYQDKLSVTARSERARTGQLDLPPGEAKVDEFFGEVQVYHDDLFFKVPIARATPEPMELELEVGYQGCADAGLCYPPQTRTFTVALPEATAVAALPVAAAPVSEQGLLAQVIVSSSVWTMAGVFFLAGLGLALTPCVLPMIPILSGIIAGGGDNVSTARGFSLALSYVMGMAIVYTGAGIAAAAIGVQLQAVFNAPWVLTVFAGLFVVLALSMFGLFDLQMPSAIQSRTRRRERRSKGRYPAWRVRHGRAVVSDRHRLRGTPAGCGTDRDRPNGRHGARWRRIVCHEYRHGRAAAAGRRVSRTAAAESGAVDGCGQERVRLHDARPRDLDAVTHFAGGLDPRPLGTAGVHGRRFSWRAHDAHGGFDRHAEARQRLRPHRGHLRLGHAARLDGRRHRSAASAGYGSRSTPPAERSTNTNS